MLTMKSDLNDVYSHFLVLNYSHNYKSITNIKKCKHCAKIVAFS